jgi:hypothetical protein
MIEIIPVTLAAVVITIPVARPFRSPRARATAPLSLGGYL